MKLFNALFHSSLGKKYVMGMTGLALFGFVIGHMLGNLQIFLGPDKINAYGAFLKSMPKLLWAARISLLACVFLHIASAISLVRDNRRARPVAYQVRQVRSTTFASRTMIWSGLIVLSFIIYHLFDFTISPDYKGLDSEGRHDIFAMVVLGFSNPFSAAFYILANTLLAIHLSHGMQSLFQSLGWSVGRFRQAFHNLALLVGWSVFIGNVSIPVAVLLGFGKEAV
jgi:succinate dehydrogenase / fumarate reductase cytochrome b subunit